jgi:hypothetical protein
MKQTFYAVKVGRTPGTYLTWEECKEQVINFSGADFRKCYSEDEVRDYLEGKDMPPQLPESPPTDETPPWEEPKPKSSGFDRNDPASELTKREWLIGKIAAGIVANPNISDNYIADCAPRIINLADAICDKLEAENE